MQRAGWAALAGLTCVVGLAITEEASARTRHRHHLVRHHLVHRGIPHRFVFRSPEAVAAARAAGEFGGWFSTGIPGPSTADPYERPGYGYYSRGYKGPGFGYPGY